MPRSLFSQAWQPAIDELRSLGCRPSRQPPRRRYVCVGFQSSLRFYTSPLGAIYEQLYGETQFYN
jgi:hypothetical protein